MVACAGPAEAVSRWSGPGPSHPQVQASVQPSGCVQPTAALPVTGAERPELVITAEQLRDACCFIERNRRYGQGTGSAKKAELVLDRRATARACAAYLQYVLSLIFQIFLASPSHHQAG